MNRVDDWLRDTDPTSALWFVGTYYTAATVGWEAYNATLRDELNQTVRVLWTGNLQPDDLCRRFHERHDVARTPGRHLGQLAEVGRCARRSFGRSPTGVAGLLSNPVICSWEAMPATSFVDVLGTAGLDAWRTSTYDAATALGRWRSARPAP